MKCNFFNISFDILKLLSYENKFKSIFITKQKISRLLNSINIFHSSWQFTRLNKSLNCLQFMIHIYVQQYLLHILCSRSHRWRHQDYTVPSHKQHRDVPFCWLKETKYKILIVILKTCTTLTFYRVSTTTFYNWKNQIKMSYWKKIIL